MSGARIAAVAALPGVAQAAIALGQDTVITATGSQPATQDYSFATTRSYWSAVLLNSALFGQDYDLSVYSGGTYLAGSFYDLNSLDFVAVNSNLRAPQTYTARVSKFSGTSTGSQYIIEYHEGSTTFGAGRTTLLASSARHAFIGDLWINAGTTLHL